MTSQIGQGHKNWCVMECGEEDLDWKVTPIPNKGLGIVALKAIPKGFRIMVEGAQQSVAAHPKAVELMPEGGTLKAKFKLNSLGCGPKDDENEVLCVRISRLNHSCDENAWHFYENDFKVKAVFASKDIHRGEEICINYASLCSPNLPGFKMYRSLLQVQWGIECLPDCICTDPVMIENAEKSKKLDEDILAAGSYQRIDSGLRLVEKLLQLHAEMDQSEVERNRTRYDGFQIAVMTERTLGKAKKYAKDMFEGAKTYCHPKSKKLQQYFNWDQCISSHRLYLPAE